MVFLKRNMFAFLNYIYFRPYMPQLFWVQGGISINSEFYHEKTVKFKKYNNIYIIYFTLVILSS